MKRIAWTIILILMLLGIGWARGYFSLQSNGTFSANLVGNVPPPDGFTRADGSYAWEFPFDYGPHLEYQTEWWYYTGNLQSADGRRFGYQLTFFRRGLIPPGDIVERDSLWGGNQVYMGHFALSDIAAQEHHGFERFSRGAAGLAGAQADPFLVWLENWEVVEIGKNEWRVKAEQDGISIDLVIADEKGVTFQGNNGYSQKGPEVGNASYYFSQTRLLSRGVVRIDGDEFQVSGLSWMDHEFSTSALSEGQIGWDWFSIQLADGTDLMVFQIRREDGTIDPFSSGTLVTARGEVIKLEEEDFDIQPESSWRSQRSGVTYPIAWTVRIPQHNLILEIQPFMNDQEMKLSYTYWEGAVNTRGKFSGRDVNGTGYVEMTGYSSSLEGTCNIGMIDRIVMKEFLYGHTLSKCLPEGE